jgi:hypothetical protein
VRSSRRLATVFTRLPAIRNTSSTGCWQ